MTVRGGFNLTHQGYSKPKDLFQIPLPNTTNRALGHWEYIIDPFPYLLVIHTEFLHPV